jgi:hypothetical protein
MNEVLETIGVDTELLSSKSLFTREETEKIFNCTHQTLKSFEKREWIKPNRFKNRTFYSTEEILRCIGKQIPLRSKVYQIDEWSGIWE